MCDEESKTHAKLLFEGLGYNVTQIPKSFEYKGKRADLKAVQGNDVVIVEAKGKEPHKVYHELLAEAKSKGLATCSRELASWGALSSVIEQATRQLDATPASATAPRVFLISCLHEDWSFVHEAFRYRLYGEVKLSLWRKTGGIPQHVGILPCFYYDFSEFCRYSILDAVILAGPQGQVLLINEFGNRTMHLRKSRLYIEALNTKALCDPEAKRIAGNALAVLASKQLNERRWQYLLDTYGLMTTVIKRYQFKGLALLPNEE